MHPNDLIHLRNFAMELRIKSLLGRDPNPGDSFRTVSTFSYGNLEVMTYLNDEPLLKGTFLKGSHSLTDVVDLRPRPLSRPMHPDHPFWRYTFPHEQ